MMVEVYRSMTLMIVDGIDGGWLILLLFKGLALKWVKRGATGFSPLFKPPATSKSLFFYKPVCFASISDLLSVQVAL